jgi:hypothetical protein
MYNVYNEERMTGLEIRDEEISYERYQKKNKLPTMASFIRQRPWHQIVTMDQTSIKGCRNKMIHCQCLCCKVSRFLYRWRRLDNFKIKKGNVSVNVPVVRMQIGA